MLIMSVIALRNKKNKNAENFETPQKEQKEQKILVISYENTDNENANKLRLMLEKRNFPHIFIGKGDTWVGFGTKIHAYAESIKDIDDETFVVLVDSRDVLVNGTPSELVERLKEFDEKHENKLIVGAERGCCVQSTTEDMRKWVEEQQVDKENPFRHLNSGLVAGRAKVFKRIYPYGMGKKEDDQTHLIKWWMNHPEDIVLDYDQKIFSNAHIWDNNMKMGCPYTLDSPATNKKKPIFLQTPGKYWECYNKLYERSKDLKDWFIE